VSLQRLQAVDTPLLAVGLFIHVHKFYFSATERVHMKFVIITRKSNRSGELYHYVVAVKHYKMYGEEALDMSCEIKGIRSFTTKDFKKALKELDELVSLEKELNSNLVSAETFEKLKRKSEFNKMVEARIVTKRNNINNEEDDQKQ
jgi:hypothetical protein